MDIAEKKIQEINWKQLFSLAGLYATVIIGWIAYYNYQPKLLEKYDLQSLTLNLFIAQGIILFITPLIAGRLGDHFRKTKGKRLPIITAGISLAAMIFMSVALLLVVDPGETFIWMLPVLIIIWIISMSIFTSPAISTVELFAPSRELPRAMAIITIVSGLLYALEPVIVDIVDYIGAPLTFVGGGLTVALAGYILNKNMKGEVDNVASGEDEAKNKSSYGRAFFFGIGFGIVTTIIFNLVPNWTEHVFTSVKGDVSASIILGLSAFLSIPASIYVRKKSLFDTFLIGLLLCGLAILLMYFTNATSLSTVALLIFGAGYAVSSVSGLPYALSVVNTRNKVFGVGVFFSGVELPNGILEALQVGGVI